ncbi:phage major capsid protein [Mammaliicoccus sciuri]|uniref:Phage major capsid protein n=1 Tax=Mammaliicoccus sciuri TaxID=1296 RepID=A0AAW5LLX7_MAMSC|nr:MULTISPECIES: phage major capsid protein [Mammaliicoccus]MCD5141245.1 phage major capsid protein [Mammaliicoccus sciuri]MCQ9302694.1 phage major capsid protein [Mammaliicoccus sciuri]MDT0746468.1 phage major capsid protein [Mammaliicoccus sciuri]MDU0266336.1 phage major capsid protein [Mammaliicoccus sciuri]MEB7839285.1 phage major capsid protein [Mammaliicoccus sciuri]
MDTELLELRTQRANLINKANRALEEEKTEDANEIISQIKELDERITKVEKKVAENENNDGDNDDETGNQQKNKGNEGEQRNMNPAFAVQPGNQTKEDSQEVRDFKNYIETRADIPGGSLKTDSGFVVIPEEIVTDILKLKEVEFNLDQYVTVKSVQNGSGKYPVVRQSQVAALPEVEELAENPELAVKPFFQLAYDIKTHRGYFRISREAIEDSKVDVLGELKQWMARTIAATRNQAIINVIKNGGPGEDGENTKIPNEVVNGSTSKETIDGLKDAINKHIIPNYEHNVAIVSQTGFNTLDKLADKEDRYLIQPDIKETSAKRLLGAKVVVLPDETLGEKGSNTLIFGNLKDAITLFDRSQYQAAWTDYMHFGECLMVAVRQDVRLLDHKAAVVIDLNGGSTEPETP